MPASPKRFEVHEHVFVSGPRANGMFIAAMTCTVHDGRAPKAGA